MSSPDASDSRLKDALDRAETAVREFTDKYQDLGQSWDALKDAVNDLASLVRDKLG